jgi:ribonuclease P protein component
VLWCTYVLDPAAGQPQVAYAIGRAFGPAVVRNRTRRQLRALLAARQLPAGWYLIGARPDAASRSSADLAIDLDRLIARVDAHLSSPG